MYVHLSPGTRARRGGSQHRLVLAWRGDGEPRMWSIPWGRVRRQRRLPWWALRAFPPALHDWLPY